VAGCGRSNTTQRLALPQQAGATSENGQHLPRYLRPLITVPTSWKRTEAGVANTTAVRSGAGQCAIELRGFWQLAINTGSSPLGFVKAIESPNSLIELPNRRGLLSIPALFNLYQQTQNDWPGAWTIGPVFADPSGGDSQTDYAVWRIGRAHPNTNQETDYWLLVQLTVTSHFRACSASAEQGLQQRVEQALTTISWIDARQ
jgi:hypothetical protein